MSVGGVNNNTQSNAYSSLKTPEKVSKPYEVKTKLPPASEYKKSDSPISKADIDKLIEESNDQSKIFEKLVGSVLGKQGKAFIKAFYRETGNLKKMFEKIQVDEETRAKAKEQVSEDGYYGAKKTSERLLNFAKAYAGDDLDKIAEMSNAFIAGFKSAEKAWGDKLPSVCQETYDLGMKGFDDMTEAAKAKTASAV